MCIVQYTEPRSFWKFLCSHLTPINSCEPATCTTLERFFFKGKQTLVRWRSVHSHLQLTYNTLYSLPLASMLLFLRRRFKMHYMVSLPHTMGVLRVCRGSLQSSSAVPSFSRNRISRPSVNVLAPIMTGVLNAAFQAGIIPNQVNGAW